MSDEREHLLPESGTADLMADRLHVLVVPALHWVDLHVHDFEGGDVVGVTCVLEHGTRQSLAVTDGGGRVSLRVVGEAAGDGAVLVVDRAAIGWRPERVRLGPLPPVESAAGQRARLDNLGYCAPPIPGEDADPETPSRWAIEEFQCEQGLIVDGVCGTDTQAALVLAHES